MSNQSAIKKFDFYTNHQLKARTEKFFWTIDNFPERPEKCGKYLLSPEFTSTAPNGEQLKWQLEMYPNSYNKRNKDYVSISLYLCEANNEEVKAKYQFSIRKPNGDEVEERSSSGYNKFELSRLTFEKFFYKREDLLNEENGYLDGGRLTIVCELTVQQESTPETIQLPVIEVPECRGMEDMSNLFEKSLFTDCKIIAQDEKEYKVHKCILGCRSPVFAAMFQHEMTAENINNEIIIPDIKGDPIEKMLRFIYSGKEPDFGEMIDDLLFAADKYELNRLKLFCERKLVSSLGSANACELLQLANLHSAEQLKVHTIDFIKMHLKEVMKSEGWKYADHQLKDQILEAMAK